MKTLPVPEVIGHPHEHQWLKEVELFIEGKLDDPALNIADVASAVYTSERQFFRRIKKLTGHTPNLLIRRKRLEKARRLLVQGDPDNLKTVAQKVGFSRTDYFSSLFVQAYGMHPSSLMRKPGASMSRQLAGAPEQH